MERTAAQARVVALVNRVFATEVSAEDCVRRVSPPVLVRLACEGVRVDVVPAATAGEDDRIVVAPDPALSRPRRGRSIARPTGEEPPRPSTARGSERARRRAARCSLVDGERHGVGGVADDLADGGEHPEQVRPRPEVRDVGAV